MQEQNSLNVIQQQLWLILDITVNKFCNHAAIMERNISVKEVRAFPVGGCICKSCLCLRKYDVESAYTPPDQKSPMMGKKTSNQLNPDSHSAKYIKTCT